MNETPYREIDLIRFLTKLIREATGNEVLNDVRLEDGSIVDILVKEPNGTQIVEVKRITPHTDRRARDAIEQLARYYDAYSSTKSNPPGRKVLAIPGVLSERTIDLLHSLEIELWDAAWILKIADSVNMRKEAEFFTNPGNGTFSAKSPKRTATEAAFIDRLENISPGMAHWRLYQRFCRDLLEYLFCPPLNAPIWESENDSGTNRKDIIFPNYSTQGIFAWIYTRYRGEYIVVDAKNHHAPIGKDAIVQLANYLSDHGAGKFGLVISRQGEDSTSYEVRREQWSTNQKMICVLSDDDLLQMLSTKESGGDPAQLIQQKIEDFRIRF
ncbi:hypothetical protein [Actinomadura rupiterrae]|uniref:hypothetical protein n=1 Tax=Actinomadura rupiterrae TaxID=559627 RepID=UPI0020A54722|nr:hypothetical protein [Actinomadura rupiterrae]MCP2341032.1 hypothetical protein [Actinomadura rupiterrae]